MCLGLADCCANNGSIAAIANIALESTQAEEVEVELKYSTALMQLRSVPATTSRSVFVNNFAAALTSIVQDGSADHRQGACRPSKAL